jgi:hypothetical protein
LAFCWDFHIKLTGACSTQKKRRSILAPPFAQWAQGVAIWYTILVTIRRSII